MLAYLHVFRIAIIPPETDAVLIVDPNAVLASAVAFQFLEAIAGRTSQISQRRRLVQHLQFTFRDVSRPTLTAFSGPPELRRSRVSKG